MSKADRQGRERALEDTAAALRKATEEGRPIPPVRDRLPGMGLDDAYRVQAINHRSWLASGRNLSGYKIGLTSDAVQRQLGVDQPDYGMLYADMAVLDGREIPRSWTIQPKVEAEVALVCGRDLAPARPPESRGPSFRGQGPFTVSDIISATEYALPCIEVVDSRIENWSIRIADTVSDNASSGLYVLGNTPRRLEGLDLRLCGMALESGGDPLSTGAGAACLGHPLNAAVWLANTFHRLGMRIQAGDVILTGALGPMVPAQPGRTYEARISGLGSVRAVFEGDGG